MAQQQQPIEASGSGTKVDAYNALTTAQLKQGVDQINNNLSTTSHRPPYMECKETTYVYDKRPQVRIDGKKYYCALVVSLYQARLKWGDDYKLKVDLIQLITNNSKTGFDASHYRCHNEHCVNENHIYIEDHRVNKSRLCCRIYGMTASGYRCPHMPMCTINEDTRIKL